MTSIAKPVIPLAPLPKNDLGLTVRDYEGAMSTLCAGCGHDSVTAAITQAFWELSTPPRAIAKLSGIGCSSKTPTYFVRGAHGFNSAHGRMPTIATGANAANRELTYIGISGDGDSLSIGLGHLAHAIRRNLNMVYVIENNGVYGLTKGQFSPSADIGSKPKRGEPNAIAPIDPMLLGLAMGATFLARSFSGDKAQLVPILKAAVAHQGLALIDVISPCVTFNDHEGSTKSYRFVREHEVKEIETDFVPLRREISAEITGVRDVVMHDGSVVRFAAVPDGYDATDRSSVEEYLRDRAGRAEIATGLLYVNEGAPDVHEINHTPARALATIPLSELCPGAAELAALQADFR
ncbi:MAG TPA: 2-oxoacid:ferredoxin oxidoreductase subunit beta [Acidimicrobiales bacterium]|nr:2-oxoacid:ferredoxin oxidoreductase subunit beta [Acidimicrobiales bacterium]